MIEKQETLYQLIASEQSLSVKQVKTVIAMLDEGNTVPFIARYRKEKTGSLDEVQIRDIMERWQYVQNLEKRKEEVIRLIEEQGKLTDELEQKISLAAKLQEVEDLYRPYKQKRLALFQIVDSRPRNLVALTLLPWLLSGFSKHW